MFVGSYVSFGRSPYRRVLVQYTSTGTKYDRSPQSGTTYKYKQISTS